MWSYLPDSAKRFARVERDYSSFEALDESLEKIRERRKLRLAVWGKSARSGSIGEQRQQRQLKPSTTFDKIRLTHVYNPFEEYLNTSSPQTSIDNPLGYRMVIEVSGKNNVESYMAMGKLRAWEKRRNRVYRPIEFIQHTLLPKKSKKKTKTHVRLAWGYNRDDVYPASANFRNDFIEMPKVGGIFDTERSHQKEQIVANNRLCLEQGIKTLKHADRKYTDCQFINGKLVGLWRNCWYHIQIISKRDKLGSMLFIEMHIATPLGKTWKPPVYRQTTLPPRQVKTWVQRDVLNPIDVSGEYNREVIGRI